MSLPTVTGNTAHTAPENRLTYPALDGLRAVAFLMVFGQHYLQVPWGWTGVNVFFVLSGFLITGILWDTRDDKHRARNFYVRRTLRIFPLYYGIMLAILAAAPLLHFYWSSLWLAWPLYLGNFLRFLGPAAAHTGSPLELAADAHLGAVHFARGQMFLGHFWSLCVEEQFYLVWPWVVFFIPSRRALVWLCSIVVVLAPIARVVAQHTAPAWMINGELTYRFTPFQLDSLLLGALLAMLWRSDHRERLLRLGRIGAPILLLAAALYTAFHMGYLANGGDYPYPAWKQTWGLCFVNVLSAALILCTLRPGNLIARVLGLAPLRWLGRISYGAYVFHDILHFVWVHVVAILLRRPAVGTVADLCTAAVALVMTLVLASLSFRFFETPFLDLKERLTLR